MVSQSSHTVYDLLSSSLRSVHPLLLLVRRYLINLTKNCIGLEWLTLPLTHFKNVSVMKSHNWLFGKCTFYSPVATLHSALLRFLSAREFMPLLVLQRICVITEHQCKIAKLERALLFACETQKLWPLLLMFLVVTHVSMIKLQSSSVGNARVALHCLCWWVIS